MFKEIINYRIRFVFILVVLLFLLVFLKVLYIEVIDYKKLNKLSKDLWSRNLTITSQRGKIYDRKGKIIADNLTTTSLVFIPNQIKNKEIVATKISKILNVSYDSIYKHANKKVSIEKVNPEGRRLDYKIADKINKLKLDGVYLLKESKRYYPYKELLSHTLGYVGIDNQGLSGLELKYDKYLTGKDGAIKYFSDGKGKKIKKEEEYQPPQPGLDLTLTIDLDIQKAIEKELDNTMAKYTPEDAIVIAMNPKNGEILGMANRPNFDSNNYKNYDKETINRNLAIWKTFEPGSTFKIMTLAAAIEEKKINLFEDKFYDTGHIKVENANIKCWKHEGHGEETFLNVVENSCNPGFVVMGQKVGKDKLYEYINKFGFGKKTNIDLNGEGSGILFKLENMGPVETATTSFGQGISVTPIQQVSAVSSAINGGYKITPHIVKTINEPNSNTPIYKYKNKKGKQVISKETSSLIRYALESVVANGTGHNAYIENYRVGGKTGTAQKQESGIYLSGNYIVSFIGFMPANDPKILIYVAINNPKNVVQYGGTVSAPIAKSILKSSINTLNIKKDINGMQREYEYYETKYIKIPNVVGMSKKEAIKILKDFKLEFSGDGDTIIYVSPKEGTYIKKDGIMKIMLGN